MPRIRSIKPEFFKSFSIAALSRDARLHFIGLWTYVDDEGRGYSDPRLLKAELWALDDDMTTTTIEALTGELITSGHLTAYTADNRNCIQVNNWDHQKIDRARPSKIPPPVLDDTSHDVVSRPRRVLDDTSHDVVSRPRRVLDDTSHDVVSRPRRVLDEASSPDLGIKDLGIKDLGIKTLVGFSANQPVDQPDGRTHSSAHADISNNNQVTARNPFERATPPPEPEEPKPRPKALVKAPKPPAKVDLEPIATLVWNTWRPSRRHDRAKVTKRISVAITAGADPQTIQDAAEQWARYYTATETPDELVPHLLTWLNQSRWETPTPAPAPRPKSKSLDALHRVRDAISQLEPRPGNPVTTRPTAINATSAVSPHRSTTATFDPDTDLEELTVADFQGEAW
jgi:hypothetical protein